MPAREGGNVVEMQRRRLLLAFTDVLAEQGLEDASVGRVCKRAGVSRRTFYDLFRDREACFAATVDNAVERLSRSVLPAHEHDGPWRERVRAGLTVLLDLFDEQPELARVLFVETLKAGPVVSERRRRVLEALVRAVDEGRSESKKATEPPPLTAQSTVGGAVSVIHARVLVRPFPTVEDPGTGVDERHSLGELVNPLMSMIVHPYLGPAAARRELERPVPSPKQAHNGHAPARASDPFKDLPMRVTFRTARVLAAIGARSGASNRQIAEVAGVADQGQMSKLLSRLEGFGLVKNYGPGQAKGEPNAWRLTDRGHDILQAVGEDVA
ncbi:MAG: TetR/AcrR family transcriptional regulator [Solirubrobacteraceae bacterium]